MIEEKELKKYRKGYSLLSKISSLGSSEAICSLSH
jgi:hypothetical protein